MAVPAGRGILVAFEGVDGSGNTTQSKLLCDFLRGMGKEVLLTKEPTDGPAGRTIRDALRGGMKTSPLGLQMLFMADRAHHLFEEIEPALARGVCVVTDRYALSTIAFGGLDVDSRFLIEANSRFLVPDITFLIDVPSEVALERVRKRLKAGGSRHGPEMFEELEKSRRVRENYLRLAREESFPNVRVIDGNRPVDAVAGDVRRVVGQLLG